LSRGKFPKLFVQELQNNEMANSLVGGTQKLTKQAIKVRKLFGVACPQYQ
jgi:hypothetical protein